jgi:hypothetical protein
MLKLGKMKSNFAFKSIQETENKRTEENSNPKYYCLSLLKHVNLLDISDRLGEIM